MLKIFTRVEKTPVLLLWRYLTNRVEKMPVICSGDTNLGRNDASSYAVDTDLVIYDAVSSFVVGDTYLGKNDASSLVVEILTWVEKTPVHLLAY